MNDKEISDGLRSEKIRPFVIDIAEEELADLHARLDSTRWPTAALGAGWDRGVPPAYLRELVRYWRHAYDWRAQERMLNSFAQYTTRIDEQNVHFLHVRSAESAALPLILGHGWPGSIAEFLTIIGPLTDPASYGGDPADAFHVVAPSLPGYGFSMPLSRTGWGPGRIAEAFAVLMARLGYDRYGVQGGDWGWTIGWHLGILDARHVAGVHLNMMTVVPPTTDAEREAMSPDDEARMARTAHYNAELSGYGRIQATRPQTLGYALNDSPVGQLAWIVEKFFEWTDSTSAPEDAVDRDQMLTNVMLYWLTGSAPSSSNLYYEGSHPPMRIESSDTPTGVALFAQDMCLPIRSLSTKRHPNIVSWNEYSRGGHFAAMEQPGLLVADVREFFRTLR